MSTGSASSKAKTSAIVVLAAAMLLSLAISCGGSDSGGSTPTTPAGPLTFTITSAGVTPKTLTVVVGSQVTFVNNDSTSHEMFSDPHPEHMDCPEINQVGFLSPGQTKQTGNLVTIRTCGFHDHSQPLNTFLQGSIVIR